MAGRSMHTGRTSGALVALWIVGLFVLSLRPIGLLERGLDLALVPVRLLSEAARPAGWLRLSTVRAAEARLGERVEGDLARRRRLFQESEEAARPEPDRFPGRDFLLAEVVDRERGSVDHVVIQLEDGAVEGLARGLPVVAGEVFVGWLERVGSPRPDQAVVALVTGRDTFVGGRLVPDDPQAPEVRMVVGGVAGPRGADAGPAGEPDAVRPRARDRYLLDVHNPSRRELSPGWVVVDERGGGGAAGPAALAPLADGFLLGRPVATGRDARHPSYGIEPRLDYRTGLFQLAVVTPPRSVSGAVELAPLDVLADPLAWLEVHVTGGADPSAWREGLKLGAGAWHGLRRGAAVVSGLYLVGRVERAAPVAADVALLGDPGFRIPALARIEGRRHPIVLGSLVTLGREADGSRVRFLWDARAPRTVERTVLAEVFTGSGEARVPRGLLLGLTELPPGEGPHEITIEQPIDTRHVRRLWVRVDAPDDDRERP